MKVQYTSFVPGIRFHLDGKMGREGKWEFFLQPLQGCSEVRGCSLCVCRAEGALLKGEAVTDSLWELPSLEFRQKKWAPG